MADAFFDTYYKTKELQRQKEQDAIANDQRSMLLEGTRLDLEEKRRKLAADETLRQRLANPVTTTTETPVMTPTVANFADMRASNQPKLSPAAQLYTPQPTATDVLPQAQIPQIGMAKTSKTETPTEIIKQHALANGDFATYKNIQAEESSQGQAQRKIIGEAFEQTLKATKEGLLGEGDEADKFFHAMLKINGVTIPADSNITFKKTGGHYSGPVEEGTLVRVQTAQGMVDTPLPQGGVLNNAMIVGMGANGKPVYAMTKDSKFTEAKPEAKGIAKTEFSPDGTMQREVLFDATTGARIKELTPYSKVKSQVINVNTGRGKGKGALPASALKMQQEEVDAIGTASGINADLAGVQSLIDSGKLDLGLISNATGKVLNYAGMSTESSRNLNTFKATLEKLRNDSLRLNKGVQTDGDAQRAWNELMSNINDKEVVKQRLGEIQKLNARAVTLRQANIDNIRNNYGLDELDTSTQRNVTSAIGNNKPSLKVGTIEGGYRFKGGDPASRASWVKVGK